MKLIIAVLAEVGKEYADEWQKKIIEAYADPGGKVTYTPKFISGIPKGDHWIRIKASSFFDLADPRSGKGDEGFNNMI
jgi:hypothetical protein